MMKMKRKGNRRFTEKVSDSVTIPFPSEIAATPQAT